MRRVTVKRFLAAVRSTGVIPTRCLWVSREGDQTKTCGIGALAVEAGRDDAARYAEEADGLGLSSNYVSGYINGFDGHPRGRTGAEYVAGWEDGRACAHAVFEERLHERYEFKDVDMGPYMDTPWGDDDEAEAYVYTGNWS